MNCWKKSVGYELHSIVKGSERRRVGLRPMHAYGLPEYRPTSDDGAGLRTERSLVDGTP